MSTNFSLLMEYSEHVFNTLDKTLKELKTSELNWRPTSESDDIYQILRHISRISKVFLPEVIKGTTSSIWNDDYEKVHHTLDGLLKDLEEGKKLTIDELSKLRKEDLEAEIPIWKGTHRRKEALITLLGDLMHHEGQIAYIRETIRRLREKDLLPTSTSLG